MSELYFLFGLTIYYIIIIIDYYLGRKKLLNLFLILFILPVMLFDHTSTCSIAGSENLRKLSLFQSMSHVRPLRRTLVTGTEILARYPDFSSSDIAMLAAILCFTTYTGTSGRMSGGEGHVSTWWLSVVRADSGSNGRHGRGAGRETTPGLSQE